MWYLPLILRIIFIDALFPWFLKGKVVTENFIHRFFLQYAFCALGVSLFALAVGGIHWTAFGIFFGIGMFNAIGAFCQWKAVHYNLSVTSLLVFLDDIIAISLGYLILNEAQFLNAGMAAGLILCIGSIIAFGVFNFLKKRDANETGRLPLVFFLHVLSFSVIWGIATFAMRYFAVNGVSVGTFLLGWYGGSFVTAGALFFIYGRQASFQEFKIVIQPRNLAVGLTASALIITGLWLSYWTLQLAPLTVANPIFFASAMIVPMVIGFYVFKEGEGLRRKEKALFLSAILGAILIAVNYTP